MLGLEDECSYCCCSLCLDIKWCKYGNRNNVTLAAMWLRMWSMLLLNGYGMSLYTTLHTIIASSKSQHRHSFSNPASIPGLCCLFIQKRKHEEFWRMSRIVNYDVCVWRLAYKEAQKMKMTIYEVSHHGNSAMDFPPVWNDDLIPYSGILPSSVFKPEA